MVYEKQKKEKKVIEIITRILKNQYYQTSLIILNVIKYNV